MAKIGEIRCRLRRGMFADEWMVRIQAVGEDGGIREVESMAYGDSVTPDAEVEGPGEVPGRLRAYVVGKTGNTAAVVLPQATMSNGPSVIIPESELIEG